MQIYIAEACQKAESMNLSPVSYSSKLSSKTEQKRERRSKVKRMAEWISRQVCCMPKSCAPEMDANVSSDQKA